MIGLLRCNTTVRLENFSTLLGNKMQVLWEEFFKIASGTWKTSKSLVNEYWMNKYEHINLPKHIHICKLVWKI